MLAIIDNIAACFRGYLDMSWAPILSYRLIGAGINHRAVHVKVLPNHGCFTGTPPAKVAGQSAPAVLSPSKEPDHDQLRERLKDDILSKGILGKPPSKQESGVHANKYCTL